MRKRHGEMMEALKAQEALKPSETEKAPEAEKALETEKVATSDKAPVSEEVIETGKSIKNEKSPEKPDGPSSSTIKSKSDVVELECTPDFQGIEDLCCYDEATEEADGGAKSKKKVTRRKKRLTKVKDKKAKVKKEKAVKVKKEKGKPRKNADKPVNPNRRIRIRNKVPTYTKQAPMTEAEAEKKFYTSEDGKVVLPCSQCQEAQSSVKDWAAHQVKVHDKNVGWGHGPILRATNKNPIYLRLLPCPDPTCNRICHSIYLQGHIDLTHNKCSPFLCSLCSKGFTTASYLNRHIKAQHVKGDTKSFVCALCGEAFRSNANLVRHERVHRGELEKTHKCDACPAIFENNSALKKHKLIHQPDRPKPFPCSLCPIKFPTQNSLNRHFLVHSKTRSEKCEFCDKAYPRKQVLKVHLKSVHNLTEAEAKQSAKMKARVIPLIRQGEDIHEPDNLNKKPETTCQFCSKKYSRREYLTNHLVTAHGKTEEEAKAITGLETRRSLNPTANNANVNVNSGSMDYSNVADRKLENELAAYGNLNLNLSSGPVSVGPSAMYNSGYNYAPIPLPVHPHPHPHPHSHQLSHPHSLPHPLSHPHPHPHPHPHHNHNPHPLPLQLQHHQHQQQELMTPHPLHQVESSEEEFDSEDSNGGNVSDLISQTREFNRRIEQDLCNSRATLDRLRNRVTGNYPYPDQQ